MQAVRDFAQKCRNRDFMGGFYSGTISNGGDPFHLSTSESAIVEAALQKLENTESLVIQNPFPTTALPVTLIASYAYSQHPNIPGGDGKPMLVFPASSTGYLSELDKFHFANTNSPKQNKTPLIPRTPIDSLSEQVSDWGLYTAKSGFVFDAEASSATTGAVFVDLRKPEWSERMFNSIEEFCEKRPDVPVIFYTDEMGPAAELTSERLDQKPLKVTNTFLASANESEPSQGESDLAVQERILSEGDVEFLQFSVLNEGLSDEIPKFIQLKNQCQNRDLAYIEVSRVFNRLTKQPFKPEYWTRTVGANDFYDDVPGYINRIERRASNVSDGSNLLYNYAKKANEIQGRLNENHVVQNTVLDAIQRAGDDAGQSRFVVKNTAERKALRHAATDSGYIIPENVEIIERANITPSPSTRFVFLYPPYKDDYVYEFPPSEKIAFIHTSLWETYVGKSIQDSTDGIQTKYSTTHVGSTGTTRDIDDHLFDVDTLESDIQSYLRQTDFGNSSGTGSTGTQSTGGDTADLVFHLSSGETQQMSDEASVTVYNPDSASTIRKKARNVKVGDEILLIDSVAGDLYDVLLESAHKREAVRDDEDLVQNWRSALDSGIDRLDMTYKDVLNEIQERGSDIESTDSIRAWRVGRYIGPDDEGDCRRILQIFRPELEGELLEQIHEQVWKAMKHLRLLHQRIGRNVRRAVEAEFNPSTCANFAGNVNERMIRNISREIERRTVTQIRKAADAE